MRVFTIEPDEVRETSVPPERLPARGFVWIACGRSEFELAQAAIQSSLHALTGSSLVDLHISDLLNQQLPSHFDYTSRYDILVFRRLAAGQGQIEPTPAGTPPAPRAKRSGPPVLRRIDTSPVGFAVFDRVVLTVHPARCNVLDHYAARLLTIAAPGARTASTHLPASPADLMLRVVNHMVDGYLDLRRDLTRQLDHWQSELLHPKTRFNNWGALLDARIALHQLDDMPGHLLSVRYGTLAAVINLPVNPEQSAGGNHRFLLLDCESVNHSGEEFFLIGILYSPSASSVIMSKRMTFFSEVSTCCCRTCFCFSSSLTFCSRAMIFCSGVWDIFDGVWFSQSKLPYLRNQLVTVE